MDLFERVRPALAVAILAAALTACGGGGGGSIPSGGGGGGTTPTPSPIPTLPSSSSATISSSTTQSQSASFGAIAGGYSGTVTIPAANVATLLNATFTTTQPAGAPAPATLQRRPQNIGASPISALAFVSVTSAATVTFPQTPAFSITLPFTVTPAIGATSYVAFYDTSKPQLGWNTIEGPSTVSGNTLSFNGTFGGTIAPLTLTANQPAYFLVFTVTSALPTPSPAPTPTATPTTSSAGYVAPTGGVTQLGPNANNSFSSSMLAASTDGTFVVQSADAPAEPSGAASPLTEYDVTTSESAAGQKPSSARRSESLDVRPDSKFAVPYRPRMDARAGMLRDVAKRNAAALGAPLPRSSQTVRRVSAFTQGNTRVFHILQGTITGVSGSCTPPQQSIGGNCYLDVPASLQYVSLHGYVWVDSSIDSSYNFSATDWQATGNAFDTDYAIETDAFGTAFYAANYQYRQCDASGATLPTAQWVAPVDLSGGDPHVSVLITRALENSGEGGYFYSDDLANDQELNCAYKGSAHAPSNRLPLIVLEADKFQGGTGTIVDELFWRTSDMPRSLPHEFQHYLHYVNKVLIRNLVLNQSASFDDSFVDEGDSMLAQDLVTGTGQEALALESAFFYLLSPGNYSLTAFSGYDANPLDTSANPAYGFYRNTIGNYGAAYLFQRYLYDRFGGKAALHRQYANTTAATSGGNVNPIMAEAANGETFAQLYGDFAAALAARNVASTDPRFTFSPGVMLVGSKQITVPGGQIYDLVLNGPRSPEDLTSTHPGTQPRIKLTPSHSAGAKLITGATLFFNAAASPGSIVSLDSTGAPSGKVAGAMVQGGYNDNGACLGPASSGC
ncbi:MAG: peptidase immune inhibitor [Candidatus Eremiobacteraeota bacterium]|nr:peptidase immune inhibitor [Candidatus Eremiobacteraeota bacterium]